MLTFGDARLRRSKSKYFSLTLYCYALECQVQSVEVIETRALVSSFDEHLCTHKYLSG